MDILIISRKSQGKVSDLVSYSAVFYLTFVHGSWISLTEHLVDSDRMTHHFTFVLFVEIYKNILLNKLER